MDGALVTVTVSDPWEFPDENEGRIAFVARIVGRANGEWLLRFNLHIIYEGQTWNYSIPVTRLVGQENFDEPGRNKIKPANILFVSDAQAANEEYLSSFDARAKPANPWVLGSLEMGIADIIPKGCDSYTEPRWAAREWS
jgi:hypothetical protein